MQFSSIGNVDSFKQTHFFQVLMKIFGRTYENATLDDVSLTSHGLAQNDSFMIFGIHGRTIFIVVIGVVFAVLTTVGNLMVMISFKIDKQLQTISNYFLFSLAVADIAIGLISIPMFTYYTAMEYWGLGYAMCQFWLCIDYLMSNASVLNLLLISFDRYFSVTKPLSYRPRRTTKKAFLMIASTYTVSLILWPPWIVSWPYIEGKFTTLPGTCVVQFLETSRFITVGTAIAAFFLPVSIMCILYARVYWETEKRQKELGKLQESSRRCSSASTEEFRSPTNDKHRSYGQGESQLSRSSKRCAWLRNCTGRSSLSSDNSFDDNLETTSLTSSLFSLSAWKRRYTTPSCTPLPTTLDDEEQTDAGLSVRNGSIRMRHSPIGKIDSETQTDRTILVDLKNEGAGSIVRLSSYESPFLNEKVRLENRLRSSRADEIEIARPNCLSKQLFLRNVDSSRTYLSPVRKSKKENKKNERKQESKAAKTLSAILIVFIVTWTPYNLLVCWNVFFPSQENNVFWTISYFLCYINSTINPLCYALCNARFRHTYKRILRFNFKEERPTLNNSFVRRK